MSNRAPEKRTLADAIASRLRSEIVEGKYKPGTLLPTRQECMRIYGGSIKTIQAAFDQLCRQGLVEPYRSVGTFVSKRLPYLHRFALMYVKEVGAGFFAQTILQVAHELTAEGPYEIRPYCYDFQMIDLESQRLLEDIRTHSLAGVISIFKPVGFERKKPEGLQHVPLVSIYGQAGILGEPCVYPDSHAWLELAVKQLLLRHRKRIALVGPFGGVETEDAVYKRLLQHVKIPAWMVQNSPLYGASRICQLLMNVSRTQRPNGLMIYDDHLTQSAMMGLAEAGCRIPQELEVVSYCNFPLPPVRRAPIIYLGCDCRALLLRAVATALDIRSGRSVPPQQLLPPVLEPTDGRSAGSLARSHDIHQ